ncbi:MAG: ribose 5-phosphate isomerase B [Candidatus Stahlbacteria bacterium]|nr:MAG: ribose 5-phosphate isomerase B [Candidatus Stahlbacteria bacterium]
MTISIGADHHGFALKNSLKRWLQLKGYKVIDVGTDDPNSTDYPEYAIAAARLVSSHEAGLGVLICGTGIGMCIAANKVNGVRAARVCSEKDAQMARRHNNANVLCFGAEIVNEALARRMVTAWMQNEFEGGRHERRVEKITAFENKNEG